MWLSCEQCSVLAQCALQKWAVTSSFPPSLSQLLCVSCEPVPYELAVRVSRSTGVDGRMMWRINNLGPLTHWSVVHVGGAPLPTGPPVLLPPSGSPPERGHIASSGCGT